MEILNQKVKVKCDVPGCKNLSDYQIKNKTFFINNTLNICDDCLKSIYEWYSKKTTPKSPVNMLNKKNKKNNKN